MAGPASNFYSGWVTPPNGFARIRLRYSISVESQDRDANTTTLNWAMVLEKDRSQTGFYGYSASWSASVNGSSVVASSGSWPNGPWDGWATFPVAGGRVTVSHNTDGTKTGMALAASYVGANTAWAPGTLTVNATMDLPPLARATTPTVSPSPASTGATVTISLPRASSGFTHDLTWVAGSLSGSIATGVATSQTWTVPSVMGEFPGKVVGPIVITAVTKNGGTVLGSRQVTLLARNPPAAPTVTVHDPAKQFDIRARLVEYIGGEWIATRRIPADTVQLVDSASATATCTIGLSRQNAVDFEDFSIVDIDVFDGANWVFTDHRFVLTRSEDDSVDPRKLSTYTGTEFVDYDLGFAPIPDNFAWDGGDGTKEHEGHALPTTPGEMMRYMLADAQSRGWGPRIGFTFDATKTSLGEPWTNTAVSRAFTKGTPLSQILDGLVTDGLVEYRTEYHDNKAWLVLLNPGTGSDYSADGASPVVNLSLARLSRAPRRATMEKQLTAVTVVGDDDIQVTRTKAPFDPDVFGRMEGWVTASGVKNAGAANTIGDNALRDNSSPSNERTFEYEAQDAKPQFYPYVVFRPADWVLIPSSDGPVKDRISQVTINKTSDSSMSLTVLTGDRILSGTASLAKRQSAQTGGAIPHGNGTTLSPLDSRIPTGPVVNSVTSAGYWNSDGAAKSTVTITWAAVTEAMSGATLRVDLYEVWWRPSGVNAEWALRGSTDKLTIKLSGWDVLEPVDFRVRARSSAGIYGEFSEDQEGHITAAPPVDLNGPIITDLYTDGVGSIYIVWAGVLGTDPAPKRMAYVVGEISTDGGDTYTNAGTPITAAGTIIINPGTWGDFTVRLRPYDRLGNPGTSSAPQDITLTDPHVAPTPPAAPTGLIATPGAAWGASGFLPEAWFDLDWDAVTLDIDGNPVEIVGYDILGLRAGETVERFLTSSATNAVRIMVGNGETWTFRATATSNYGAVSEPSEPATGTADATISATAAPTAPTLDQYAGLLRIKWAGGGMVPQIKYVYAAISTTESGTYTRAGMPLLGAGEVVVPGLAPGDYYAKIVMVDEMGNSSTSAASDVLTLLPITGVTIQTSELANTGIKITSGALTAYDVSGNPTFILDADTGEVWIAPYDSVFDLGASGTVATTGAATNGIAISSENSSFNTFIHPAGLQIRNDQNPLSWWEADVADANLVNFFSPRAVIGQRFRVGDFEMLREAKSTGSRLVVRYKGA